MDKQRRTFSNRIRTIPQELLDEQRSLYLNLENAEPNLGYPELQNNPITQPYPELDHVLVARRDGTKVWSQRPEGLRIDGFVSEILNKYTTASGSAPGVDDLEFGELFVNVSDATLFIKGLENGQETIFQIETGIQGPQGIQGIQGIQGERQPFIPVQIVGDVVDVNATYPGGGPNDPQGYLNNYFPAPNLGDAVFDLATSDLWVWTGSTWLNAGLLRGPQGVQGIIGPQGINGPQGAQGSLGIQGPRGFTGIQGSQGTLGTQGIQGAIGKSLRILGTVQSVTDIPSYPGAELGVEIGDAYIVLDDGNIYIWSGSQWVNSGRILIQGTQGIQGGRGIQGPQGIQGYPLNIIDVYNDVSPVLDLAYLTNTYATAPPFSGVIDITFGNGILWQKKENGFWEQTGIVSVQGIQGPQGAQGTFGLQGIQGTQGLQGPQGIQGTALVIIGTYNNPNEALTSLLLNDLFPNAGHLNGVVDISDGNGYLWLKRLDGAWENVGITSVQGVQGPQGTQGVQGLQGLQGFRGYPLNVIDTYNDPLTQLTSIYLESNYPTSDPYSGVVDISSGQGILWQKNPDGTWTERGVVSVQGVQGPQGPQGPQGTQGLQGVQGLQGLQGVQGPQGPQGLQGLKGDSGGVTLDGTDTTNAEYYVIFDEAPDGLQSVLTTSPGFRYNPSVQSLSVSGLIYENGLNIVSQADVGTNPNQIPLNGFLGSMAFANYPFNQVSTSTVGNASVIQINAPTTDLYAHIADFTVSSATIQVSNLTSGHEVRMYLRNVSATTSPVITISASESTVGYVNVALAPGAGTMGAASVNSVTLGTTNGTAVIWVANVAGEIVGGVMA